MKVTEFLSRKGKFTVAVGAAVCGAVALTCYGYGVIPPAQGAADQAGAAQAETVRAEEAGLSKARYGKDGFNVNYEKQLEDLRQPAAAIGKTVAIDSGKFCVPFCKGDAGKNYDWDGTMEFTVLSADVYGSIDDAPLAKKQVNGYANRDIACDYEKEGGYFLLFKVKVHNVDAKLGGGGYLLSTTLEPAGGITAADPVYLDCSDREAVNPSKPEYVRVGKGETVTLTCGWAVIPERGGSTAEHLAFDSEGLNLVSLAGAIDHRSDARS